MTKLASPMPTSVCRMSSSLKLCVKAVSSVAALHSIAPAIITDFLENRFANGPMKGAAIM